MAYNANILLAAGTNEMEILEFYIDELIDGGAVHRGSYGINVAKVLEIIPRPKVSGIPLSPPSMAGTFILRNKVIGLIDLAVQLGISKPKQELNPLAMVTEFNKTILAFAVSGVNRIHRLGWSQIEPAEPILGSFSNSLTGIVKLQDCNLLILDMEKILAEMTNQYSSMKEDEVLTEASQCPIKALIADDSSSTRKIVADKLEEAGFMVRTASDGKEAWTFLQELKRLSQTEKRPIQDYMEVIISDIEMPQMDGYTLCQAIKRDQILKALPVILFSSLINDRLLHKGRSVGADDQISKPELIDLAERIRKLIGRNRTS